jgi:uncharacterized membrane protein
MCGYNLRNNEAHHSLGLNLFKQTIRNSYLKIETVVAHQRINELKTVQIAMTAVCAALYVIVGYLSNLGIVSPVVGVVRFWPAVIVPGVFAILFGPWVGGVGAGIGIFFSDMIYGHGIALLSLTIGVPSNFLGFFLIGYIGRKNLKWKQVGAGLGLGAIIVLMIAYLIVESVLSLNVAVLFLGVFFGTYILAIAAGFRLPEWKSYEFASVVGLAVGSAWIGFGLWAYSQFLPLPLTVSQWARDAPFYGSLVWLVWTFATEIPFLAVLGPPIIKACYMAFPSLQPKKEEQMKEE